MRMSIIATMPIMLETLPIDNVEMLRELHRIKEIQKHLRGPKKEDTETVRRRANNDGDDAERRSNPVIQRRRARLYSLYTLFSSAYQLSEVPGPCL